MRTLREVLEHTPTALLREMARFWGVPGEEKSGRPGLVSGLLAQMGRPEAVRRALGLLDQEEREALRAVLAAGGQMQASTMARAFGPLRSQQLAPTDPATLNPTERLHRKALLFRAFAAWDDWQGAVFFVPVELRPHLPRVSQATPADMLRPLESEGVTVASVGLSLHRDLACVLALLQREDHALTEEFTWSAGLLAALAGLFPSPHPAYAAFLLSVAWQAGLLASDMAGVLRPTAEGRQWLRASLRLRVQSLFPAWRDHPGWDDLGAIPELVVERLWPADLVAPRRRVLRHLAAVPPEDWLALSDWVRFVEARDPEFLRPSGAPARPRLSLRETDAPLKGPASWHLVEGRYLDFLLRGPLHWLGVVELGREGEHVSAFRLTPLGYALLHPEAGLPDLPEEPIMVEGTFEVWVPVEASPYAFFALEGCAERVRQDQVSQYRLSRESLHGALGRGERVDQLLDLLARLGRGEVPQNVAYTLREWAAAYGRLSLQRPILLSAEDALLLEEILADPAVRAACGETLSPSAVMVEPGQVRALVTRLEQLGHSLRVEEGILLRENLPPGESFSLSLTPGQGAALVALLWAVEEILGRGKPGRALSRLAETLTQMLPPARLAWAKRQQDLWQQYWAPLEDDTGPAPLSPEQD